MGSWWVFHHLERGLINLQWENVPCAFSTGLQLALFWRVWSTVWCLPVRLGGHTCLRRGLALKHCVLMNRVALRLCECSRLYLERVFLHSWNDDELLVVLEWDTKNTDSAGLWSCQPGEKRVQISLLPTSVRVSLISTSHLFFLF